MQIAARLLEQQAGRCLTLAYQCKNKNAERILRLLAVDLMLAVEQHQRANMAAQIAKFKRSIEARPVKEVA